MIFQPVLPIIVVFIIFSIGFFFVLAGIRSSGKISRGRWWMRATAFLLLTLTMFRPGIPYVQDVESYVPNTEIFFMVDTTSSMYAVDGSSGNQEVTRLDAVKSDISRIVDQYPNSRVSLITFDHVSRMVVPLTRDVSTFMVAVNGLTTEVSKHSFGSEVRISAPELYETILLAQEVNPDNVQMVFFFSDGEETSESPTGYSFDMVRDLIAAGQVYGYGAPDGAKMLNYTGYYVSNSPEYIEDPSTGEPAVSIPDKENLVAIADELGVEYQERYGAENVTVPDVEQELQAETLTTDMVEDYTWVVGLLVLLFVGIEFGYVINTIIIQRKMSEKMEGV